MATAPKLYTRLTRNVAGLGAYSSLWLGNGHLMLVRSTGYTEDYSRVELRDIRAIFLLSSGRRKRGAAIWAAFATLGGAVGLFTLTNGGVPFISGPLFGVAVIALVWNHLLGPTCQAYVVTGVQTARLPSLVRTKKAHRVLGRLQPLIATAQADLAAGTSTNPPPASPPPAAT